MAEDAEDQANSNGRANGRATQPPAAIDIDTVMARIRRHVAREGTGSAAAGDTPAAGDPVAGQPPATAQAALAALAQADLNRSIVDAFQWVAADLQSSHADRDGLRDYLRQQADQVAALATELPKLAQTLGQQLQASHEATREAAHKAAGEAAAREAAAERVAALAGELPALARRIDDGLASAREAAAAQVADAESRLRAEAEAREAGAAAQLGQIARLAESFGRLSERLGEVTSRVDQLLDRSGRLEQHLAHELDEMRMRVLRAERRLRQVPRPQCSTDHRPREAAGAAADPAAGGEAGGEQARRTDENGDGPSKGTAQSPDAGPPAGGGLDRSFDYFMFEHRFRGPVAEIKQRQRAYLDLFAGRSNVIDLGCGRGEFVELLTEQGVGVRGVDSNEDMVDFCRDRGLPVERADLFDCLERLPDAGADGVFAAQVVEHLPPELTLRLLALCHRKLGRNGVLVLETINPNCTPAMKWFYLDPSHVRPVPAELLRFMAEQEGFRVQAVRFSSPLPGAAATSMLEATVGMPEQADLYQDFAVVAYKN